MSISVWARIAGLLGGLCWVGRAVADQLDSSTAMIDALHWGGLALIAIALVGLGAELVSSSALWLRILVALCVPLLIWSVLEALRGEFADRWVECGFGALLALYCGAGLLTTHRPRRDSRGAHAK